MTPALENLILNNKAVYKTLNIGTSGVGTLPNPNSRTIIVTDIIYHSFCDNMNVCDPTGYTWDNLSDGTMAKFLGVLHTLRLKAKNDIAYTFRESFRPVYNPATDRIKLFPGEPMVIKTYFVANETIKIDIKRNNNINQWQFDSQYCPDESNEEEFPLGYGRISSSYRRRAIQRVRYYPSVLPNPTALDETMYIPMGVRNPGLYNNSLRTESDFRMRYALVEPQTAPTAGNYNNFPVVTLGYVEITDKYKTNQLSA